MANCRRVDVLVRFGDSGRSPAGLSFLPAQEPRPWGRAGTNPWVMAYAPKSSAASLCVVQDAVFWGMILATQSKLLRPPPRPPQGTRAAQLVPPTPPTYGLHRSRRMYSQDTRLHCPPRLFLCSESLPSGSMVDPTIHWVLQLQGERSPLAAACTASQSWERERENH